MKRRLNDVIISRYTKLVIAVFIIFFGLSMLSQAATLDSSSTSPQKIFKCQASTIKANYSNTGDIVSVDAILTLPRTGVQTVIAMTALGGGRYQITFGNDNTTLWGNYTVGYRVNTASSSYINTSTTFVFVYNDECTGTNIAGYQNVSYRTTGFGNYTKPLFSGDRNVLAFAEYPFIEYFGYAIYVIVLFFITGIVYLKSQTVAQPLIVLFVGIAGIVSGSAMPDVYRLPALFIIGSVVAVILWRVFKSS